MTYTGTADLPVPPDEAFALVTEPERLRRWQTVSATVELRAGGAYRWTVVPGNVAGGTFREVEPGRRIVFGWGWEGSDGLPPDASTVTVTLEPTDEGTRVTLVHEGLDDEQEKMHAEGWEHYLERLRRAATTGDAGPDEWAAVPQELTPVTAAEAALGLVQPVLRGLQAEDRTKPTPCADFDVHQVAVHLMESLVKLGAMVGVTVADPDEGSIENRLSVMAMQAIDGWRAVGPDGTVPGPDGRPMPAAYVSGLLPVELLLHGWDMAQGSGQPMHAPTELVDYLRELTSPLMPSARERGSFGAEVEAEPTASPMDRFAAWAGRRPLASEASR